MDLRNPQLWVAWFSAAQVPTPHPEWEWLSSFELSEGYRCPQTVPWPELVPFVGRLRQGIASRGCQHCHSHMPRVRKSKSIQTLALDGNAVNVVLATSKTSPSRLHDLHQSLLHVSECYAEAAGLLSEVSPVGMEVFGFHDLPDSECASKDARWWTYLQIFLLSFMRTRTFSRPSDVGAAIGLRCGHRSHHLKPVPANGANQLQRMSRDTCKTRAIRTRCLASLVVLASSNFRLGGQSFWNLESWRKICVHNSRLIQPGKGQKWRLSWNIMESWWIMMIIMGIHFISFQ